MKIFFFFLTLFISSVAVGQKIEITGQVRDSLGAPLEMANVIALKVEDSSITAFAFSDNFGRYELKLPVGSDYKIKVSFLGMRVEEKLLSLTNSAEDQRIDFILFPQEDRLNNVEIIYQMPVTKRGDTLIYDADSFINGTERKLGDVLKKLPGIEITRDGEIEVEGKKVSKVMVEGKDFFSGDSKLATKNIPADAVSKVEVLKNYNEVDQMRGLGNDEDKVAINLKLKEGKQKFWFGELLGGGGEVEGEGEGGGEGSKYTFNSRLFYYSPKIGVSFIGNKNNHGEVPFSIQDYFRFTGGATSSRETGASFKIREDDLSFLITQNDRAARIETSFGAVNFNYHISDKWDLSGFALLNDNEIGFNSQTRRNYIKTNIIEDYVSTSKQGNRFGMGKFKSVFKPDSDFQLNYEFLAKSSGQEESTHAVSQFSNLEKEIPILVNQEQENFSVNQTVDIYYTLKDNHIFAGKFSHLFKEEDPFYNAVLEHPPFSGILPLEQNAEYNINQTKQVRTQRFDAILDYYLVLNKLSNINLTAGTSLINQDFNSSIFQQLPKGHIKEFNDPSLSNDVSLFINDIYLGLKYKVKTGIFTLTPGFNLHHFTTGNLQSGLKTQEEDLVLLPNMNALMKWTGNESISLNYMMSAEFTDIHDFAEGFIFNSYNRLFQGNRTLDNGYLHNVRLNYFNFNMYNFTNIIAGVSYNKRLKTVSPVSLIDGFSFITSRYNSNSFNDSYNIHGSFSKSFGDFKTKASTNLFWNSYDLIVNETHERSHFFTQNYEGSILTNFKKSPHLEIGYGRNISRYNNAGVENVFYTDRPFANIEVAFFNSFSFLAEWNYYNYYNQDRTLTNEYSFLEASLQFRKPDSRWEFILEGQNLLNVKSLNMDNFGESFSSTTQFLVQPRIVMASIKYVI